MSFWDSVCQSIQINVQKLKEAISAVPVKKEPGLVAAEEHLAQFSAMYDSFRETIIAIIAQIETVAETGAMIAESLPANSEQNWNEFSRETKHFLLDMRVICKEKLSVKAKHEFLESIRKMQNRIIKINKLKEKQNETRLLVNSLESDLRSYADKAADEKFIEQLESKKQVLALQSKEFIDDVEDLWVNRFKIFDELLNKFVDNFFTYMRSAYFSLQEIHKNLPNENWDLEFLP